MNQMSLDALTHAWQFGWATGELHPALESELEIRRAEEAFEQAEATEAAGAAPQARPGVFLHIAQVIAHPIRHLHTH